VIVPSTGGVAMAMAAMGPQMGDVMTARKRSTGLNSSSRPPPIRTVGMATRPGEKGQNEDVWVALAEGS
jgi:hypothetical protein